VAAQVRSRSLLRRASAMETRRRTAKKPTAQTPGAHQRVSLARWAFGPFRDGLEVELGGLVKSSSLCMCEITAGLVDGYARTGFLNGFWKSFHNCIERVVCT
jgi:hypothetical protein